MYRQIKQCNKDQRIDIHKRHLIYDRNDIADKWENNRHYNE